MICKACEQKKCYCNKLLETETEVDIDYWWCCGVKRSQEQRCSCGESYN